jgi:hypothetical protein
MCATPLANQAVTATFDMNGEMNWDEKVVGE